MAVFKCKMCGGDLNIVEGSTIAQCEYCGAKQTVPNVDSEKKLNLFNRANRLRISGEFDKAASIYENIVAEFPDEAEAYWGLVICNYGIEYVDDPVTANKVPTCHRASFEPIENDENYKSALKYADTEAQNLYHNEAKEIDRIRREILSISQNEKPYDVFICYKETAPNGERTVDSVLAQDIYDALTEKGFRVFFSRVTLEDKLGAHYEPYIFAALNSAKVMLCIGTSYENFSAVWVKNEWHRFLKLMGKNKSKLLIPCYKDMDAYDLPEEFRALQGQDLGKIGAIQDIVRGVKKVLNNDTANLPGSAVAASKSDSALLDKAFSFLEDGNFEMASPVLDQLLEKEPENAMAYVGKLMVELQIKTFSAKNFKSPKYKSSENYKKAMQYADDFVKSKFIGIEANLKKTKKILTIAIIGAAAVILAAVGTVFAVRENNYQTAIKRFNENISDYSTVYFDFESLGNYRDSKAYAAGLLIAMNDPDQARLVTSEKLILNQRAVNVIGDGRLSDWSILTEVILTDNVVTFPAELFKENSHLKKVVLGNGIKEISNSAFAGCSSLTNITLPNSVTSIGNSAFARCSKLTSIDIPNSVTEIGDSAFFECSSLASVVIPNGVTSIGISAFSYCTNLTNITIPNSVTHIGNSAFARCSKLTSIDIPNSVTEIGGSAFAGCSSLASVVIPNKVTRIGDSAFFECSSLASVVIPNGVTSIGISAFSYCTNLTSVVIPESCHTVSNNLFSGCTGLTEVYLIGEKTIAIEAFHGCDNLKTIYCTAGSIRYSQHIPKSVKIIYNADF